MSEAVGNVVRIIARHPGKLLARTGISPNAVTILGGVLSCGVAATIGVVRPAPAVAGLLILGATFFDALDGAVAKQTGRSTKFGAFLDSVTDRVSDAAVLLGLLAWKLHDGAK